MNTQQHSFLEDEQVAVKKETLKLGVADFSRVLIPHHTLPPLLASFYSYAIPSTFSLFILPPPIYVLVSFVP